MYSMKRQPRPKMKELKVITRQIKVFTMKESGFSHNIGKYFGLNQLIKEFLMMCETTH